MTVIYSPYFIVKSLQESALKRNSDYLKGKILDIGCGTMPYKRCLRASSQYIGMDESEEVKPSVVGKVQEIPFQEESFDSVLCTEILEHLPEPDEAIKEIKRVLKAGGYLYLTVPQTWALHYEPNDYFRFTRYGIIFFLKKNDLRVISVERIGGIFSLVGQRIVDVSWSLIVSFLKSIFGLKWAERFASILVLPISIFFYFSSKLGDKIDKRDALGWAVLAMKCNINTFVGK